MTQRKGIILAGGRGTRLHPSTIGTSKQLLPVYDKPMIYYPLSVLMLTGIRDIAIITNPEFIHQYQRLLGDGSQWGVSFTFIEQPSPDGLTQAYILGEEFLNGAPSALILGDNIFYGDRLPEILKAVDKETSGGSVFGYQVSDPENYGVVGFDAQGRANSIIEKPDRPASNHVVTGLYFLDGRAPEFAKTVTPSKRGELEITTLLEIYLHAGLLSVQKLGRGFAWLDTGTHASLLEAGNFVQALQRRQGLLVGSPDEVSFRNGWISAEALKKRAKLFEKNEYGALLKKIFELP